MAEIYGTVAGFKAYHDARYTHTIGADDKIAAALVIASEWLDARYRSQFGGYKVGGRDQVREWPREGHYDYYGYAVPSDAVPREVENATYEAAHAELEKVGILSTNYTPSKYKQVSVDGAVAATYAQYDSSSEFQTRFALVSEALSGLLNSSNVTSNLSGTVART